MHTLKMSLGKKVSNHQKNKAAEHAFFQNTGVKKLTGFKTQVKGVLFDMTDRALNTTAQQIPSSFML